MNRFALASLLLVSLAPLGCGTEADLAAGDEPAEASETSDAGDGKADGFLGATAAAVPRVMTRSASGSSIVVGFDRAVTAEELPLASIKVEVVRLQGTSFRKSNVLQRAALSADRKTLTMTLTEPLRSGTAYYTRGTWKRCVTLPLIGRRCTSFRAEFGEVVVTRSAATVVNGSVLAPVTVSSARPRRRSLDGESQVSAVAIDGPLAAPPVAAAGPGTFRVRSMTPIEESEANTRDLRSIQVVFEGGTIDCAAIPPGLDGFRLYSRSPDLGAQQLMYQDPTAPNPSDFFYKGDLRCQEQENRLIFTTPGRLFGDVQYMVQAHVASKQGDQLDIEKAFYTERPGIRVSATRVENHYGTHDTCDSDGFFGSDNYCDVYVTSGIATGQTTQTARIPDTGDFSGMRYFPTDATNGARPLQPVKVLFQQDAPIGVALTADLLAHDADSTTGWKKFFTVLGEIATKVGGALAAAEPRAGAITAGVGAGLTAIGEAIPENEDDRLGDGKYTVTRENNRWGTTAGQVVVDVSNRSPSRGPIKVFLVFEEFPTPWHPNAPIL